MGGIGEGKTWSKYIARKNFSITKRKKDDTFAILRHQIKSNEDIFIVYILSTQYYPHIRTKNFTCKNYFFVQVCQKSSQEMLRLLVALTERKSYINTMYKAIKKLNYCRNKIELQEFSNMERL